MERSEVSMHVYELGGFLDMEGPARRDKERKLAADGVDEKVLSRRRRIQIEHLHRGI